MRRRMGRGLRLASAAGGAIASMLPPRRLHTKDGRPSLCARTPTADIAGLAVSEGLLTQRGGHALPPWCGAPDGQTLLVGCGALAIDLPPA
ncbi:MAG: hypothetical protein M5R42_06590 [Rhodocyclaceae bacterium]|nr:hypothetical protein [Rhodocyclaceae bacterium]